MQTIPFFKYQGTGNDFVMIDNRTGFFRPTTEQIAHICHRRFGIGADGLILLENHPEYDFQMVYYNADGRESSMCGNGGRCIVRFAADLGVIQQHTTFLAIDGPHEAFIRDGLVHLKMIDVAGINQPEAQAYFLNTGSPHYVAWVQDLAQFPVVTQGSQIRHSASFQPAGTNVNFVEKKDNQTIAVRTFERGVEDETYSCGTGVTAAALVSYAQGMQPPIVIETLGGRLQVDFVATSAQAFEQIFLIGPAQKVFEGQYFLTDL